MRKYTSTRSGLALGISGVAMAMALVTATPAAAQSTSTAAIQGHVDGAQPGATVTVTDEVTGQRVTVKTDANGNYNAIGLRPSTYRVQVNDEQPIEVVAPVGQTIVADLATAAAAAAATTSPGKDIVVTGSRGRVDPRASGVSTSVSRAQIENLPQSDRNFLNFAALAPGVNVSPPGSNRQVQAGATSPDNTNVFIDGFSLKNPINHGGLSGQNFSQGNPFPQLAVQEFAVNTQNFKAEYEQAGSAIITAVTKTGGQKFSGDAFIEYQPKSFISRPLFRPRGQSEQSQRDQPQARLQPQAIRRRSRRADHQERPALLFRVRRPGQEVAVDHGQFRRAGAGEHPVAL
ncbi:TonB-dependent receptor [Sphingomonas panacisoli]|uniref:TonB-dependent receptor n=1 Tax=Sphingomonas panacisoli TaxID=1813879 RepID=UPI001F030939|nr:carboxypeptidase-like regulatory domain-containing protein [Sphingomonas panacisoli]